MTVKELIEYLQTVPGETEVLISKSVDGRYGKETHFEYLNEYEIFYSDPIIYIGAL